MKDRFLRFFPFALGALMIAGIVHIAIVLLMPDVASTNAAQRLMAGAPLNGPAALRPANEALPLPFADPAMVTAVCRFDIDDAPLRLRLPTGDTFLSVVALSPSGRVLVGLTDRAATRRLLNIVLVTPAQLRQLEAQDPDDEPLQELRLRLPETKGVAVIRALALRESERGPVAAALARTACGPE